MFRVVHPHTEKEFRVAPTAREIVDSLTSVLTASVVLYDTERHEHHLAMRDGRWLTHRSATTDEPRLCFVQARINDRWTLYVCARRRMHPDAESIAKWASDKLAPFLPKLAEDGPMVPPFGGGGSGGSAESGIPVWWARKARN